MANYPQIKINLENVAAPKILYLGQNDHLEVFHEQVAVENEAEESSRYYDFKDCQSIICFGNTEITSKARSRLMRENIPVHFLSPTGEFLGRLSGAEMATRKLAKLQEVISEEQQIFLTRRIVYGALKMIKSRLTRWGRSRDIDNSRTIREVEFAIEATLRRRDITVEALRGMLGSGFRLYWQEFYTNGLIYTGFSGKSIKEDSPVNDMLAFMKTLLEVSLESAIAAVGLDPTIGIFHSTYKKQLGLVSDLALELFHLPHSIVVKAVNCQIIVAKDFDNWQPGQLPQPVTEKLVALWQKKMTQTFTYTGATAPTSFGQALVIQPMQIAQYLQGKVDDYAPLILR